MQFSRAIQQGRPGSFPRTASVFTMAEASSLIPSQAGSAAGSREIDLPSLTLVEAARRIRQKQLSPVELTQAVLDRITACYPQFGVIPRAAVDREGIQTILEIREVMGEMEAPLPSPEKSVDDSYLQQAIQSLGGG